jgi:hypothetical protein
MVKSDEIEVIMSQNDLNLSLKTDIGNDYEIERISENDQSDKSIRIKVADEFYLRGEVKIEPNKMYKLSVTIKNESANPVLMYSFWHEPKTSVRNYTLAGENGNPPTSKTQEIHKDWITFSEYFEAEKGEDSFMLALFCQKGVFSLKDIKIEEVKE